MNWDLVIAQGIVGGGAALLVGSVGLVFRWLLIGIRSDLRRLFGKPEQDKVPYHLRGIKKDQRVEPTISKKAKWYQ